MKANEAPEKITISKYNITDDGDVVFAWLTNSPDCEPINHPIEYIRTDAFIEKAVEWLKENAEKYIWYSDYAENLGDDTCGMNDDFIKDFKKAIKLWN